MANREYFLGIDGGGSKTTAVVFDENGNFICSACGESINYYSVGLENARLAMTEIINSLSVKEYTCAFIGMSALNERASAAETERFCGGVIKSDLTVMDSDLFVALEAMNAQGECACIISGTGSMAVMRGTDGKISHTGGWGYILGDEGSGYAIGLSGIKAAIKSAENCADETALVGECLKYFSINNIYDLIDLYYEKKVSRKTTAAFARLVNKWAENGDKTAIAIIEAEAEELFRTAYGLLKSAKSDIPVGLWGGIFQNNLLFRKKFTALAAEHGFRDVRLIDFTPEIGAIFAAYKLKGIDINENIINNISTTYIMPLM